MSSSFLVEVVMRDCSRKIGMFRICFLQTIASYRIANIITGTVYTKLRQTDDIKTYLMMMRDSVILNHNLPNWFVAQSTVLCCMSAVLKATFNSLVTFNLPVGPVRKNRLASFPGSL